MYTKGLHIMATFKVDNTALLSNYAPFKELVNNLITTHQLTNVGDTYHSFPEFGFTANVCLTESHLSIHTWPEYGLATFDVFLSNFKNDNSQKVTQIFEAVKTFFNAEVEQYNAIER